MAGARSLHPRWPANPGDAFHTGVDTSRVAILALGPTHPARSMDVMRRSAGRLNRLRARHAVQGSGTDCGRRHYALDEIADNAALRHVIYGTSPAIPDALAAATAMVSWNASNG